MVEDAVSKKGSLRVRRSVTPAVAAASFRHWYALWLASSLSRAGSWTLAHSGALSLRLSRGASDHGEAVTVSGRGKLVPKGLCQPAAPQAQGVSARPPSLSLDSGVPELWRPRRGGSQRPQAAIVMDDGRQA